MPGFLFIPTANPTSGYYMTYNQNVCLSLTILGAAVGCFVTGLRADTWQPAAVSLALFGLSLWWRTFSERLRALSLLIAFSASYAVLTYCFGMSQAGFCDDTLRSMDRSLGFDALAFSERWQGILLSVVYFGIMPLTMLVIAFGDAMAFTNHFIKLALLTAAIFCFAPALGSCGIDGPDYYRSITTDLIDLKVGTLRYLSWQSTNGIVTLPSFHVIWALLLLKYWPNALTFVFAVLTPAAAIVVGYHYLVDVLVAMGIVYLTRRQQ